MKTPSQIKLDFEAELEDYYERLELNEPLDFSGRIFNHKTVGDFWIYDSQHMTDLFCGWCAAQVRIKKLEEAYAAACAFIDCHAADPDINGEMIINHRKFVECREGLDSEIN